MTSRSKLAGMVLRAVNCQPGELLPLLLAFVYHFSLLCGYYVLRPVRDEMGIAGGVENLHYLFLATFLGMLAVVPLFGWLTSRFSRRTFIPASYAVFIAMLFGFYLMFQSSETYAWVARGFFVWVSVFNLFVVSVFWSFMTDLFDDSQAKRLFPFIAAGGTAGALVGPALTGLLVQSLGATRLLFISMAFLGLAILCVRILSSWADRDERQRDIGQQALGGGVFAGIRLMLQSTYLTGIGMLILLYATTSTFLYFQQAYIIRSAFDDAESRTALFAAMDFAVNFLVLLFQIFFTGRIIKRFGLRWALATIPLLVGIAFLYISFAPVLAAIVAVQVLRRVGNYALMRPARETLYVVLPREEKYKAKNFIDTTVYRTGDAVSAWAYAGMGALGLGLSGIALVGGALSLCWAAIAWRLGIRHDALQPPGEASSS